MYISKAGVHWKALAGSSVLLRLISYVQTRCEVVNGLRTFVGVSQLPVEMNGDIQASQTIAPCSSAAALGSPFSRGPPINHNSWRCNFLKSDLSCYGGKKKGLYESGTFSGVLDKD